MNKQSRLILIAALLLAVLALTSCTSIPYTGPGLVIGQSYRLQAGDSLNEDLTVVGGNATLEEESTVNGDVVVIGGNVLVDGQVNGDLMAMGGMVTLGDHAVVQGQVHTLGGTVERSSRAVVEGKDLGNSRGPGPITAVRTPGVNISFEPITATLMAIFQAMALAALAVVINLFAPRPMERTGQSAMLQAPASGGVGCLTILVLAVMAVTIILLPVSLLGMLIAGAAVLFGWTALGLILGRRMAAWLNQIWTDPVSAGVGTLTLSLLTSIIGAIPCIGWTVPFFVGMIALGAVVLTRFGTQLYPAMVMPASPTIDPNWRVDETRGAEIYPPEDRPRSYPPENTDDTPQI